MPRTRAAAEPAHSSWSFCCGRPRKNRERKERGDSALELIQAGRSVDDPGVCGGDLRGDGSAGPAVRAGAFDRQPGRVDRGPHRKRPPSRPCGPLASFVAPLDEHWRRRIEPDFMRGSLHHDERDAKPVRRRAAGVSRVPTVRITFTLALASLPIRPRRHGRMSASAAACASRRASWRRRSHCSIVVFPAGVGNAHKRGRP